VSATVKFDYFFFFFFFSLSFLSLLLSCFLRWRSTARFSRAGSTMPLLCLMCSKEPSKSSKVLSAPPPGTQVRVFSVWSDETVRRNHRCLARFPRNLDTRMPAIQIPFSALSSRNQRRNSSWATAVAADVRLLKLRKAETRAKSTCAHRLVSGNFTNSSPSPTLLLRSNVSFLLANSSRSESNLAYWLTFLESCRYQRYVRPSIEDKGLDDLFQIDVRTLS